MNERIMYVCKLCSDNYPEGCGHYSTNELRVMPDGSWLCENCYEDAREGDFGLKAKSEDDGLPRWSDFPIPPEYGPIAQSA